MFKLGELLKRKSIRANSKAVCVVVDKTDLNYTLYKHSSKCLQVVASPVVEGLYSKVIA